MIISSLEARRRHKRQRLSKALTYKSSLIAVPRVAIFTGERNVNVDRASRKSSALSRMTANDAKAKYDAIEIVITVPTRGTNQADRYHAILLANLLVRFPLNSQRWPALN